MENDEKRCSGRRDENVVDAYLRYLRSREEECSWAWQEVTDLVTEHPRRALEVVVALINGAESATEISHIAAGPLEDLVHSHGGELVQEVDAASRASKKFQGALGQLWCWSDLPESVRAQYDQVPGVPRSAGAVGRSRRRRSP